MKKQKYYHPKFFPAWILIGLMKLGAKLPFKVQVFLGRLMGKVLYHTLTHLRGVAFSNIAGCFPDKTAEQVKTLVKQHFEAIGISAFETANAYFASNQKIAPLLNIQNEHYFTDAKAQGKSVILLAAHFMPLMLGSRALLLKHQIANIYRPQNNRLFDQVMHDGFADNGAVMIKTKDTRSMLKAIKNALPIWYAPDQDLGKHNSVFAPFFNIQTATVSATARLAKGDNTVVIPYFFIRTEHGYDMVFEPALEHYPNQDEILSATQTNQILEQQILRAPEQYLWIHKRFKTRPPGDAPFYWFFIENKTWKVKQFSV